MLSENFISPIPKRNSRIRSWHHDWKHQQGYSRQEIEQKAKSISKIMPTETLDVHIQRLKSVGFRQLRFGTKHIPLSLLVAEK